MVAVLEYFEVYFILVRVVSVNLTWPLVVYALWTSSIWYVAPHKEYQVSRYYAAKASPSSREREEEVLHASSDTPSPPTHHHPPTHYTRTDTTYIHTYLMRYIYSIIRSICYMLLSKSFQTQAAGAHRHEAIGDLPTSGIISHITLRVQS